MATTKSKISDWFDAGVLCGATHMIVASDTFSYEEYPVYVRPGESVLAEETKLRGQEMTSVMEIYNLHLDKQSQLAEHRAFHR